MIATHLVSSPVSPKRLIHHACLRSNLQPCGFHWIRSYEMSPTYVASDALDVVSRSGNESGTRSKRNAGVPITSSHAPLCDERLAHGIIRANRQAHDEAAQVFHRVNDFGLVGDPAELLPFLARLPEHARRNMRSIHIASDARTPTPWNG